MRAERLLESEALEVHPDATPASAASTVSTTSSACPLLQRDAPRCRDMRNQAPEDALSAPVDEVPELHALLGARV